MAPVTAAVSITPTLAHVRGTAAPLHLRSKRLPRVIARSTASTLLAQGLAARQLQPTLLIPQDDLDGDEVSQGNHIADFAHVLGVQLGDMAKPLLAGQHLDERSEVLDADDATFVDPADLDLSGELLDHLLRCPRRLAVFTGDGGGAVVVDLHLGSRVLLDLLDHLAARADDHADLLHGDLHLQQARSVGTDVLTRLAQGLDHLLEDVNPPLAGLLKSVGQDLARETLHLDVHLDSGDALAGTRDLEVHVAHVVLGAEDVREDHDLAVLLDQPHGNTRHRLLDGDAGVHHGEGGATNAGHG